MNAMKFTGALFGLVLLAGCTSYRTPGGGVSIPEITTPSVAEALARKPAAVFPARIALVRVQASGYVSPTNRGYGYGAFTVITTRDVETEADIARFAAMPQVAGVGTMSRILLPSTLHSADDLRVAAAQLQADILLLYTLDTSFRTDTTQIGPLQLVSLGFFPNKKAHVTTTCASAFIDTRTGYVYGVSESTATEEQRSDLWNSSAAIEKARSRAERGAFTAALGDIEKLWASIAAQQKAGSGGAQVTATP